MKIIYSDINIGDGWFYYQSFIDPTKSIPEQVGDLKEDMLQIAFGDGQYIVDVGWYPSFDINGKFKIFLIENQDWENRCFEDQARSIEELDSYLKKYIDLIAVKTNNFKNYPPIDPEKKLNRRIQFKG